MGRRLWWTASVNSRALLILLMKPRTVTTLASIRQSNLLIRILTLQVVQRASYNVTLLQILREGVSVAG